MLRWRNWQQQDIRPSSTFWIQNHGLAWKSNHSGWGSSSCSNIAPTAYSCCIPNISRAEKPLQQEPALFRCTLCRGRSGPRLHSDNSIPSSLLPPPSFLYPSLPSPSIPSIYFPFYRLFCPTSTCIDQPHATMGPGASCLNDIIFPLPSDRSGGQALRSVHSDPLPPHHNKALPIVRARDALSRRLLGEHGKPH